MDLGLAGKKAIVCGASRGLGYGAARALAEEGAELLICARSREGLQQAADELEAEVGVRPLIQPADLTRPADRQALADAAVGGLGQVDILVANAGGPPSGPFESHPPEHWQLAVDLALGSVTHLCSLLLPGMRSRGFGRIVQIVSVAGLEVIDGLILSNASRPAVLGFARALAREVGGDGVLVNSICPGIFLTQRIRDLAVERAARMGISAEAYVEQLGSDIPVGRPGDPRELGDLAAFLCSPRNTYINGATVVIDGGKIRRLY
ncbi:MAG: SDR family oxidoreductase [Deltaproteobacteria bacterium]|nr:SDR family oxidoreductase [Deltaproteobacteria bacterium]